MSTDAELLLADIESRADALNTEHSAIVQAPAGSGKTELLIQRYLKLLAVVNEPEEILAITFTRKAAQEMRLRIVDALRRAQTGSKPDAEHERITYAAAVAAIARDRECDWNLVESPGRMRIQTVDAFNAGVARSLPLSSGLGGISVTLSGAEMTAMYREAAAATFESLGSDNAQHVERVLEHLDNHTRLYIAHLSSMLAYRDQWLAMTGSGLSDPDNAAAAREQLEKNIEMVVEHELERLATQFPADRARELVPLIDYAAANLLRSDQADHPLCRLAGCQSMPGSSSGDRSCWQAISGLLLTQSGDRNWRKSINKNDGFPAKDEGQKESLYALIQGLSQIAGLRERLLRVRILPDARYADEQWEVLLSLLRLLPLAVGELLRLFGERGVSDYIQVAQAANEALGTIDEPGDIALMLDYRIAHLLVDEMQDTSFGQYELIRKLTAGWTPGDGRTLFCVGDPMQSIYGFRDTDVGQFLLARRDGIGSVKPESLLLHRNFRSGEHLVHWFNTVFSQVMPQEDDISYGAISYAESVPVEAHANRGDYRVHPLFDAGHDEEANHALGVVRDCLQRNPGDDVAVLVRSRTVLTELLHALRHAEIPYRAVEIDHLTDLPEIIDLLALTRALCHEADRLAWLALLRGPWVGLTWSDIHRLVKGDTRSTVRELIDDDSRVASLSTDANGRLNNFRERIAIHLRPSATDTLRDRVELAWFALGGPAMLRNAGQVDNVYRFFDVIAKLESGGTLADVQDLERLLDKELVSSRFDPECRLQIMTMHKAKGLQFDHVVLFGIGRGTRPTEKAVLSWLVNTDSDGRSSMILSPVGPRSEMENDPLHQFIETTRRDKERLELDRLLYVACTRARKSLHLVGNVGLRSDGQEYRAPPAGTLLHRLWPAIEQDYARAFAESGIAENAADYADDDSYLVQPVLRRLTVEPPAEAPELPARTQAWTIARSAAASPVDYYWVGAELRHAGTIVHRWLQKIADGTADIDDRAGDTFTLTSRKWARSLGVAEKEIDAVCARVQLALDRVAEDDNGRRLLFGNGKSELGVTGVLDGGVQSVVIDRIFVDENGVHWIVDYKTSTHEGGDLAGFLQQEKDRYRAQLERYARLYGSLTDAPVKAALYFPLLQEFVEIELQDR